MSEPNGRLYLKQLVRTLFTQIQCAPSELFCIVKIIFFVSDMRKIERRNSLVIQHGLIANGVSQDLLVQLLGLFQLTLPVANLAQHLEGSQHAIIILSCSQQGTRFKDIILRIQNSTCIQSFITNDEQTVAAPEHIMLWKFIQ